MFADDLLTAIHVVSLPATSSSHIQHPNVVVPEQVTTGLYDWLKATGDEMGTIEGVSFVWNHTGDVSVYACYAPNVLNAGEVDAVVLRHN